ncbi:hypothetical protein [Cytobacillus depressus]|uniref:hypothetical protein n=1 Tax=Cytobacillus depressus TaxID=1602942 RepID=UPI0031B5741B
MGFIVSIRNFEIGPMKAHEYRPVKERLLFDPNKPLAGELKEDLPTSKKGFVGDLMWPILTLIV